MADPLTPTIRLTEPAVGGDNGAWGNLLNNNSTYIDEAINQTVAISIPDTNITLVADGSGSDTARYAAYKFTGSLTATRTVTLPGNQKFGTVINATTGSHPIILTAGGATISVPADSNYYDFYCDGTNVFFTSGTVGTAQNNGVIHFPNGITMQFGNTFNVNGVQNNFTYTFSGTPWSVTVTPTSATGPPEFIANLGTATASGFTSFTGITNGASQNLTIHYVAVGPT